MSYPSSDIPKPPSGVGFRLREAQRFIVPESVRTFLRRVQRRFNERRKISEWARLREQNGRLLHFLHIQKNGGTALRHALDGQRPQGPFAVVYRGHGTSFKDVPRGDGIIVMLRDPVSRFVSGFRSRQTRGLPRYYFPWTFGETLAFRRFHTPEQLASALSSRSDKERASAVRAMKSIRHVNAVLSAWFISSSYVRERRDDVFFVGAQETLAEDFERLKVLIGMPDAQLPKDPVTAYRRKTRPDDQLSEQSIANLREWYAEDYRLIEQLQQFQAAKKSATSSDS